MAKCRLVLARVPGKGKGAMSTSEQPSVGSRTCSADPPSTAHFRELSDDGAQMAATEQGRQFLKYLVSCALLPEQGAYVVVDGVRHDFPGSLGLAPHWLDQPLTETEQRWVSAGILARTNFFGVQVQISTRHPSSGFVSLAAGDQELRDFTLYEGDFFGNVFAEQPVACVAVARRSPEEQADPILQRRVGTEIDPGLVPIDGKPITRCGFIMTGYADDPDAHTFRGVGYDEYISVYLKPERQDKA